MATTVRITETYDLKTTKGRIGIIGIHTPASSLVRKLYPGLCKNHKFIRFVKCDVVGACASVLPADPLQVGVSAGEVAPEDMFNPILMKAVTNESFDNLVSRIYALQNVGTLGSVAKDNINATDDQSFQAYYSLLSENGRFRKAMPQTGFALRSLIPICHTLISTYGNVAPFGNKYVLDENGEDPSAVPDLTSVGTVNENIMLDETSDKAVVFRGKPVKMPKIPLHYHLSDDGAPFNVPETYVAMLIIPPARLHEFYYRMRVSWLINFEQVISTAEVDNLVNLMSTGALAYAKDYNYTESKEADKMDNHVSSVDTSGVDINKIMES